VYVIESHIMTLKITSLTISNQLINQVETLSNSQIMLKYQVMKLSYQIIRLMCQVVKSRCQLLFIRYLVNQLRCQVIILRFPVCTPVTQSNENALLINQIFDDIDQSDVFSNAY
jgi:hypothetical protein